MKILITTDLYTTETNGVVTSVKNLCDELTKKGHDVRILTLSEHSKSYRKEKVYYVSSMPLGVYPDVRMSVAYKSRFVKELIDWRPDIIHSQCEFFSFQYALKISKHTDAPIVHTYHTLYEQYVGYVFPVKKMGKYIVKFLSKNRLKKVEEVIAPTHKVEDTLKSYGIEGNVKVIPSGISIEKHGVRLSEDERREKRLSLGIDENDIVLLNLGRLGTEKNLDELLTYYSEALYSNPRLKFMIVGDGPAREELEALSAQLGLKGRVIFTGMVNPENVQEYYQLGDIFVSASTSETQGLTYIEAAANGLPLLCREDLCLKNVIKSGENGYAYTNVDEFLEDIELIVKDPEWMKSAREKSEEIAKGFNKESFGKNIEDIYQEVLDNKK